jgi:hypothetical protein
MSRAGDGGVSSWFTIDRRPLWWLVPDGVGSNGATEFLRCSTRLRLGWKRWWSSATTAGSEARFCGQIWWNQWSSGWFFIGLFGPRRRKHVGLYLQADLDPNRFQFNEDFVGNKDLPFASVPLESWLGRTTVEAGWAGGLFAGAGWDEKCARIKAAGLRGEESGPVKREMQVGCGGREVRKERGKVGREERIGLIGLEFLFFYFKFFSNS